MWVCRIEGVGWGRDGTNSLWDTGQSIFNVGPKWREVSTLHCRPLPQARDFSHFENFTCTVNTVCFVLLYHSLYIYFFPLRDKNKPCEGFMTPAFILGPVSIVVNKITLIYSIHALNNPTTLSKTLKYYAQFTAGIYPYFTDIISMHRFF
jgi:hypothetical protein